MNETYGNGKSWCTRVWKKWIGCLVICIMTLFLFTGCAKEEEKTVLAWQPTVALTESVNLDDTLTLTPITDGVVVVEHRFPWSSNSMIVELEDQSILWVDTPCTPEATQKVLDWIRTTYGQDRIITVFNTGYHFDNLGGNKVLAEEGIAIYASDVTGKLITDSGEEARKQFLDLLPGESNKTYYDTYASLEYAHPCAYIKIEEGIEHSIFIKSEVEVYYPGKSHAPDNVVVYIEDRRVLFGGCMVKSEASTDLGNTADADLVAWPKSLDKIGEKYSEQQVDFIVPGHGLTGTYTLLEHTKSLCQ